MAANLKIIKLITGEDLLAEVETEGDVTTTVKNPVRIVLMPNKVDPKTPNVGFAPWMEFSEDKTIDIDNFHILAKMTPIKEFANHYNSMFGGIVVPTSNLILPGQ